jgi:predicted  nucleic acid-binding Zn-ribbon protein
MRRIYTYWPATALPLLVASTVALAQSPAPTQEQMQFFQKAIANLQAQRNKAEDDVVQATTQAQIWHEQLEQSKAQVKSLEDQLAKAKSAAPLPPPATPAEEPKK